MIAPLGVLKYNRTIAISIILTFKSWWSNFGFSFLQLGLLLTLQIEMKFILKKILLWVLKFLRLKDQNSSWERLTKDKSKSGTNIEMLPNEIMSRVFKYLKGTLRYQIRVQHQIRVQADHFEISNKNTASNKNTGNQILKFSAVTHPLKDRKFQFFGQNQIRIQYRRPHFKILIRIQHQIMPYRRYFFQKINKNTCTPIWYLRVLVNQSIPSIAEIFGNTIYLKHFELIYTLTFKEDRIWMLAYFFFYIQMIIY